MIIGAGNIASVLNDRLGCIFFASGVSNSQERDPVVFEREYDLLMRQPKVFCLFYFSTISINFTFTPYTLHKRTMEKVIHEHFENYNILRIGNLVGDTNPNTFVNFIRDKRAKGEPVEILDQYRYMLEKKDLLLMTDNLPLTGKNIITVTSHIKKVVDCI